MGARGAKAQRDSVDAPRSGLRIECIDLVCVVDPLARAAPSREVLAKLPPADRSACRVARGVDGASRRVSQRRQWTRLGKKNAVLGSLGMPEPLAAAWYALDLALAKRESGSGLRLYAETPSAPFDDFFQQRSTPVLATPASSTRASYRRRCPTMHGRLPDRQSPGCFGPSSSITMSSVRGSRVIECV